MIEFPESKHLAEQMKEHLLGKTIMNVEVNKSPHKFAFYNGDPLEYHDKMTGKTVTGTNSYGGMPEVILEDKHLVFGDGANIRFYAQGEKLPEKHQIHIEFDDFSSITCSVQMYGLLYLMDIGSKENEYYEMAKSRISPLSDENNEDYFLGLMDSVKQSYSIKAFLATEQRYPGLGNGVLQDILFHAKVHPRRKIETLTSDEKNRVYESMKQTLFEMTAGGGRDTEKDLFGCPGGYKTKLSVKTKNLPCPVCGDTIIREAYLGGNIYFCPTCQKYEKPKKKTVKK